MCSNLFQTVVTQSGYSRNAALQFQELYLLLQALASALGGLPPPFPWRDWPYLGGIQAGQVFSQR